MTDINEIVRVAARGEGVTGDGRHAALAAPGDILASDGTLTHGPHHQIPPCRHFPECGGCQLQHLDDPSYAEFVRDRVASALDGQGLSAPIRTPIVSPPRSRRRATLHAERGVLGFSEEASHRIVDMRECWVIRPEMFALVGPLRTLIARLAPKKRVSVDLTLIDQGVDVLLGGFEATGLAASEALIDFAQGNKLARLSIDGGYGPETRWEPDPVTITLGGIPTPFPHAAFLQATAEGEATLVAGVKEAVAGAATIADLFAGLGTFALALPGRIYAGEGARDALFALKVAAGAARRPVFAEHRDLFRRPLTAAELNRFDAAVLDPPRAGARDQVEQIAQSTLARLAYVSCNPSTFARDAKTLCDSGMIIEWVQPVGQFLWSTHVELIAAFRRPDSPR